MGQHVDITVVIEVVPLVRERAAASPTYLTPPDIAADGPCAVATELLGRLGDLAQRLDEFLTVGEGQGLQQGAFGAVGGIARAAQRLAARTG